MKQQENKRRMNFRLSLDPDPVNFSNVTWRIHSNLKVTTLIANHTIRHLFAVFLATKLSLNVFAEFAEFAAT